MASEGDRRADPEVERRSRLLGGLHFEGEGAKGVAIALLSTAVFVTVVVVAVTQSSGWPEVKRSFFDWGDISNSFPDIARAFGDSGGTGAKPPLPAATSARSMGSLTQLARPNTT